MLRGRTGRVARRVERCVRQPATRSSLAHRPPIGAPARRKTISAWRGRGEGSCGAGAAPEFPVEFTRALQLASAAAATSILAMQRAKAMVPKSFWTLTEAYARANTDRPLATRVVTTALLSAAGDVMAQAITSEAAPVRAGGAGTSREPWYDPRRTLVMASWGLIGSGPFNHFWYMWLDRSVALPRLTHSVGLKIALDHIVYFPVLVGFFAWTDYWRGRVETVGDALISAVFSDKLIPVMQANVVAWTGVHVLTFTIIPPQYHVLWVSVASLFWSGFCSCATEDS
eukprot:scaffold239131_cov26-Tisochrysis_lutea.AAC.1